MAYTTIDDPSAQFQTLLYTGNSSSPRDLVNDGNSDLQPDFVWVKGRSHADIHLLYDSSRGGGNFLRSASSAAENTGGFGVTAFNSDGFRTNAYAYTNENTHTYVAWQWKANGGTTASNSNGSITSTVQANTDAGMSIVQYTGTGSAATIGHGLGVAPAMYIVKNRDQTGTNWTVFHKDLTSNAYSLYLNSTAAQSNSVGYWNGTSPTSTVFSIKNTSGDVNTNTEDYVVYCFANVQGYSKAGKYIGNGSTDNAFVYTGFKPACVIIKCSSAVSHWRIFDHKRLGYNPSNEKLYPNLDNAEGTATEIDFLSNGFKIRSSDTDVGNNSSDYIYMAWAENPFVSSEGVPTTAR